MRNKPLCFNLAFLAVIGFIGYLANFTVYAAAEPACILLMADRLFDGTNKPKADMAVLVEGDKITSMGPMAHLSGKCGKCSNKLYLGNVTLLPGFIDSHTHITANHINKAKLLQWGITTAQDTGGPLKALEDGEGSLRLLSTGPILQAPGGYPLNVFGGKGGYDKIGYSITSMAQAQAAVRHLYDGDATAVKISLEPGGENGAPWMQQHGTKPMPKTPWPMLSLPTAKAIVATAQEYGMRTIAHASENNGFKRALAAGVDEFDHIPCARISDKLLQQAVKQGVTFVTSLNALMSCVDSRKQSNGQANLKRLAAKHAKLVYGSYLGLDKIVKGIDSQELSQILNATSGATVELADVVNLLKLATSRAGERLGQDSLLGRIAIGAPADIIAVRGNPFQNLKLLEHPDFVMSGGKLVVNKLQK